jgi:hypothetical protein
MVICTICKVVLPDSAGLTTEVAVTVTVLLELGTDDGAWYKPVGSIEPQPLEHGPESDQVTAWLELLGLTVAMNCWVVVIRTWGFDGETLTEAGGELVTVTIVTPTADGST